MRKHIKKIGVLFGIAVLLLSGCGVEKDGLEANEQASETIQEDGILIGNIYGKNNKDVVLVMDESGSMVKADPGRFAIEGAKLFIDMEKANGDNIALVEFSNEVKSTGLIELKHEQNKKYIKTVLDDIQYSAVAHTDTGAAMLKAVSVLEESESNNDKAIVLFTDGVTDIDVGTPGRTTQDSLKDVEKAVEKAKEKGYKIYCIGLNYNGSVDEAELARMAVTTNGLYHIASNVDELREFFNAIFMEMNGTTQQQIEEYVADGDYHDSTIPIDKQNVVEANIFIFSSIWVDDIVLADHEGNVIDLENSENVHYSKEKNYSLIKLIRPSIGEWHISVKGVTGDKIKVGLVYNYDINLLVETDKTSVVKGNEVRFKVYFSSEGESITDNVFYKNVSGYFIAEDKNTGQTIRGELVLDDKKEYLTGTFTPPEETIYQLFIHTEGNGFSRDSDVFEITSTKNPVVQNGDMEEIKIRVGESKKIDLNEYFKDEEGMDISYSMEEDNSYVKCQIEDNILNLTGEVKGTANITIFANNGSVEIAKGNITVNCTTLAEELSMVFLLLIALVLLILVWLVIRKNQEKVLGVFKVTIVSGEEDQNGAAKIQAIDTIKSIPASAVGARGFTLEKLIQVVQGYYMTIEYDEGKKEIFAQCVSKINSEAGKIKVRGSRKPYEIIVKNKSNKVQFVNNYLTLKKKEMVVFIGNSKAGVQPITEKEFGIRFVQNKTGYVQINVLYSRS